MTPSDPQTAAAPQGDARPHVAIVGGGPAGLMAAETLLQGGASVDLYDAMPSVGRKFLLAGKGGLNLTHSEPLEAFLARYDNRAPMLAPWLQALGPQALRDWASGLGIATFIGSSGRVFPAEMKAAPLLRAWLRRLRMAGLRMHMRYRWNGASEGDSRGATGFDMQPASRGSTALLPQPAPAPEWLPHAAPVDEPRALRFDTPAGEHLVHADAVLLALGGASWPQLGSDGAWAAWLAARGVGIAPLQAANCGFDVGWSEYFARRFGGAPMKSVRLMFVDGAGRRFDRPGEFVVTAGGIEGSLVYAASALIRDEIAARGQARIELDLVPGRDVQRLSAALAKGRGARSLPNHLREYAGLDGVKAALLRERYSAGELARRVAHAPAELAREIKAWPITLTAARPVTEAISTAGGVSFEALDARGMLRACPGWFCAGEMLDWEAPTGGYLLTACFASGRVAGQGVLDWWQDSSLQRTTGSST